MNYVGALDLFTIGIGPSSSHTVGPMRAAKAFATEIKNKTFSRISIKLYGSLGATGAGHGTTNALIAGLAGFEPETANPEQVKTMFDDAIKSKKLSVYDKEIVFEEKDLIFAGRERLERHSNGMLYEAFDGDIKIHESVYFSVGGGFIEQDGQEAKARPAVPYPYSSALELVEIAEREKLSIAELALANDIAIHGREKVEAQLIAIWLAMKGCIKAGLSTEGVLPGYLKVPRRAKAMAEQLSKMTSENKIGDLTAEWLQAFAIAVNEENAAGNRVVTAPTNGAAGIIPAVAYFAHEFRDVSDEQIAMVYLPTAAAIGSLYKRNASISGAEAGCQGEVGSACSMAAAAITAVMGGTAAQIENAAEIAMEHNLGLTCDPVGGFVQLPCIERNAIAAGTAVAAMRLALLGDGSHKISLDTVIETMRQTGMDMSLKYKETSTGGLAVNVVEC
jgi:L-serine dehydratase